MLPMSEEKEDEGEKGASPQPPPKPPDDSKDSSTESDRDVSSGEDSDSVEAMTTAFRKVLSNKKRTSKAVKSSAPLYASLFPVAADKAEVGRENQRFTFPATKFYDDDDLSAPPGGFLDPPRLFPIIRQHDARAGMINVQYMPLEYEFFKDLKAAVSQYGPQSPSVLSMLENLGTSKLILPLDWESIAQAVLEGSQWLQLRSW